MSTITQIENSIIEALGNEYAVVTSFDANESIDPSGTMAVMVNEAENMNHTGCNDYRFGVTVNGIALADEDKSRQKQKDMLCHAMSLDLDEVKSGIDGCVGIVIGQATTNCDGDSNEFSVPFDIYVCDASFEA